MQPMSSGEATAQNWMSRGSVTVVCPFRNAEESLARTLASIDSQDYPHELIYIVLVDGGSTDHSKRIASNFGESFAGDFGGITVLENPAQSVAAALNLALQDVSTEYWLRIDAHSELSAGYIQTCRRFLESNPDVAAIGGITRTVGRSRTGVAIAWAQSSPLGVGASNFRTARRLSLVDTTPFALTRMEAMRAAGEFDISLARNQDDEHNARIRDWGTIYVTPACELSYYCRNTYGALAAQYFGYGQYKPVVMFRPEYRFRLRHFVPPLLVVSNVGALLAAMRVKRALFLPLLYVGGVACVTPGQPNERSRRTLAMVLMHWAYGCGMWWGIGTSVRRRVRRRKDRR